MKNIWTELKKPIMVLAPMDDVTDSAFRRLVAETAKPDLFFTEFANVEGLFSPGNKTVMRKLYFTPEEQPLIAQLWGMDPALYEKAAEMVVDMGFSGIDLNMGCPERSILKKGCCAALINNPEHAGKIIAAVKRGVMNASSPHPDPLPKGEGADRRNLFQEKEDNSFPSPSREKARMRGTIPVSVKTRIGVNEIKTEEWISFLLEQDIDALTVHGRTAKEMSAVPAHWDEIGKAVAIKNSIAPDTILIGNGDVRSLQEAKEKVETYGVDGVMIGRGIFENVWVFDGEKDHESVQLQERLRLLLRHMELFEETWKGQKNFQILKKFFKIYVKGFEGASEVRVALMEAKDPGEVREKLKGYL